MVRHVPIGVSAHAGAPVFSAVWRRTAQMAAAALRDCHVAAAMGAAAACAYLLRVGLSYLTDDMGPESRSERTAEPRKPMRLQVRIPVSHGAAVGL